MGAPLTRRMLAGMVLVVLAVVLTAGPTRAAETSATTSYAAFVTKFLKEVGDNADSVAARYAREAGEAAVLRMGKLTARHVDDALVDIAEASTARFVRRESLDTYAQIAARKAGGETLTAKQAKLFEAMLKRADDADKEITRVARGMGGKTKALARATSELTGANKMSQEGSDLLLAVMRKAEINPNVLTASERKLFDAARKRAADGAPLHMHAGRVVGVRQATRMEVMLAEVTSGAVVSKRTMRYLIALNKHADDGAVDGFGATLLAAARKRQAASPGAATDDGTALFAALTRDETTLVNRATHQADDVQERAAAHADNAADDAAAASGKRVAKATVDEIIELEYTLQRKLDVLALNPEYKRAQASLDRIQYHWMTDANRKNYYKNKVDEWIKEHEATIARLEERNGVTEVRAKLMDRQLRADASLGGDVAKRASKLKDARARLRNQIRADERTMREWRDAADWHEQRMREIKHQQHLYSDYGLKADEMADHRTQLDILRKRYDGDELTARLDANRADVDALSDELATVRGYDVDGTVAKRRAADADADAATASASASSPVVDAPPPVKLKGDVALADATKEQLVEGAALARAKVAKAQARFSNDRRVKEIYSKLGYMDKWADKYRRNVNLEELHVDQLKLMDELADLTTQFGLTDARRELRAITATLDSHLDDAARAAVRALSRDLDRATGALAVSRKHMDEFHAKADWLEESVQECKRQRNVYGRLSPEKAAELRTNEAELNALRAAYDVDNVHVQMRALETDIAAKRRELATARGYDLDSVAVHADDVVVPTPAQRARALREAEEAAAAPPALVRRERVPVQKGTPKGDAMDAYADAVDKLERAKARMMDDRDYRAAVSSLDLIENSWMKRPQLYHMNKVREAKQEALKTLDAMYAKYKVPELNGEVRAAKAKFDDFLEPAQLAQKRTLEARQLSLRNSVASDEGALKRMNDAGVQYYEETIHMLRLSQARNGNWAIHAKQIAEYQREIDLLRKKFGYDDVVARLRINRRALEQADEDIAALRGFDMGEELAERRAALEAANPIKRAGPPPPPPAKLADGTLVSKATKKQLDDEMDEIAPALEKARAKLDKDRRFQQIQAELEQYSEWWRKDRTNYNWDELQIERQKMYDELDELMDKYGVAQLQQRRRDVKRGLDNLLPADVRALKLRKESALAAREGDLREAQKFVRKYHEEGADYFESAIGEIRRQQHVYGKYGHKADELRALQDDYARFRKLHDIDAWERKLKDAEWDVAELRKDLVDVEKRGSDAVTTPRKHATPPPPPPTRAEQLRAAATKMDDGATDIASAGKDDLVAQIGDARVALERAQARFDDDIAVRRVRDRIESIDKQALPENRGNHDMGDLNHQRGELFKQFDALRDKHNLANLKKRAGAMEARLDSFLDDAARKRVAELRSKAEAARSMRAMAEEKMRVYARDGDSIAETITMLEKTIILRNNIDVGDLVKRVKEWKDELATFNKRFEARYGASIDDVRKQAAEAADEVRALHAKLADVRGYDMDALMREAAQRRAAREAAEAEAERLASIKPSRVERINDMRDATPAVKVDEKALAKVDAELTAVEDKLTAARKAFEESKATKELRERIDRVEKRANNADELYNWGNDVVQGDLRALYAEWSALMRAHGIHALEAQRKQLLAAVDDMSDPVVTAWRRMQANRRSGVLGQLGKDEQQYRYFLDQGGDYYPHAIAELQGQRIIYGKLLPEKAAELRRMEADYAALRKRFDADTLERSIADAKRELSDITDNVRALRTEGRDAIPPRPVPPEPPVPKLPSGTPIAKASKEEAVEGLADLDLVLAKRQHRFDTDPEVVRLRERMEVLESQSLPHKRGNFKVEEVEADKRACMDTWDALVARHKLKEARADVARVEAHLDSFLTDAQRTAKAELVARVKRVRASAAVSEKTVARWKELGADYYRTKIALLDRQIRTSGATDLIPQMSKEMREEAESFAQFTRTYNRQWGVDAEAAERAAAKARAELRDLDAQLDELSGFKRADARAAAEARVAAREAAEEEARVKARYAADPRNQINDLADKTPVRKVDRAKVAAARADVDALDKQIAEAGDKMRASDEYKKLQARADAWQRREADKEKLLNWGNPEVQYQLRRVYDEMAQLRASHGLTELAAKRAAAAGKLDELVDPVVAKWVAHQRGALQARAATIADAEVALRRYHELGGDWLESAISEIKSQQIIYNKYDHKLSELRTLEADLARLRAQLSLDAKEAALKAARAEMDDIRTNIDDLYARGREALPDRVHPPVPPEAAMLNGKAIKDATRDEARKGLGDVDAALSDAHARFDADPRAASLRERIHLADKHMTGPERGNYNLEELNRERIALMRELDGVAATYKIPDLRATQRRLEAHLDGMLDEAARKSKHALDGKLHHFRAQEAASRETLKRFDDEGGAFLLERISMLERQRIIYGGKQGGGDLVKQFTIDLKAARADLEQFTRTFEARYGSVEGTRRALREAQHEVRKLQSELDELVGYSRGDVLKRAQQRAAREEVAGETLSAWERDVQRVKKSEEWRIHEAADATPAVPVDEAAVRAAKKQADDAQRALADARAKYDADPRVQRLVEEARTWEKRQADKTLLFEYGNPEVQHQLRRVYGELRQLSDDAGLPALRAAVKRADDAVNDVMDPVARQWVDVQRKRLAAAQRRLDADERAMKRYLDEGGQFYDDYILEIRKQQIISNNYAHRSKELAQARAEADALRRRLGADGAEARIKDAQREVRELTDNIDDTIARGRAALPPKPALPSKPVPQLLDGTEIATAELNKLGPGLGETVHLLDVQRAAFKADPRTVRMQEQFERLDRWQASAAYDNAEVNQLRAKAFDEYDALRKEFGLPKLEAQKRAIERRVNELVDTPANREALEAAHKKLHATQSRVAGNKGTLHRFEEEAKYAREEIQRIKHQRIILNDYKHKAAELKEAQADLKRIEERFGGADALKTLRTQVKKGEDTARAVQADIDALQGFKLDDEVAAARARFEKEASEAAERARKAAFDARPENRIRRRMEEVPAKKVDKAKVAKLRGEVADVQKKIDAARKKMDSSKEVGELRDELARVERRMQPDQVLEWGGPSELNIERIKLISQLQAHEAKAGLPDLIAKRNALERAIEGELDEVVTEWMQRLRRQRANELHEISLVQGKFDAFRKQAEYYEDLVKKHGKQHETGKEALKDLEKLRKAYDADKLEATIKTHHERAAQLSKQLDELEEEGRTALDRMTAPPKPPAPVVHKMADGTPMAQADARVLLDELDAQRKALTQMQRDFGKRDDVKKLLERQSMLSRRRSDNWDMRDVYAEMDKVKAELAELRKGAGLTEADDYVRHMDAELTRRLQALDLVDAKKALSQRIERKRGSIASDEVTRAKYNEWTDSDRTTISRARIYSSYSRADVAQAKKNIEAQRDRFGMDALEKRLPRNKADLAELEKKQGVVMGSLADESLLPEARKIAEELAQ